MVTAVQSVPGFLPFCRPTIGEEEIASVVASLRSGWLTSGPKVLEFERAFREWLGVPHAIALNSATAGLHVALAALDVGPGDEVVTTSLTWPSAVNCIELLGARPVFADVVPGTLQIDPADVRRRLTDRTKVVIPVHYAGAPADLDELERAVAGTKAVILEDAAHAAGTKYRGQLVGSRRTSAVFSFHPIKNMTTGEGGMMTTHDDALAGRVRLLRFHGVSKDAWSRYGRGGSPRYEVIEPGWKYNMLDLQAAIGIEQLKKLERFNARRAELADLYSRRLADVPEVRPLAAAPYPHEHSWHLFIVQLALDRLTIGRDDFIAELGKEGIGAGIDALVCILQNDGGACDGKVFNIGNPANDRTIRQLAEAMVRILGTFPAYRRHAQEARIVERPAAEYYGDEYQDMLHRVPSIRRARAILGWEPRVGFEEALRRTIANYVDGAAAEAGALAQHA